MTSTLGWTISEWLEAYRSQTISISDALHALRSQLNATDPAWIYILSADELNAQINSLALNSESTDLPLYGVPFAVKDNIDVAGIPTTAACPAFTYIPSEDATTIARLKAAGAVVIGKTNLDQFATGLVGTRSPYGAV
ncbi:MAG TPA: amidase family protein, partial [Cellvibrio sp.]|nr:amidase family protein [Cellvibrio sp.]